MSECVYVCVCVCQLGICRMFASFVDPILAGDVEYVFNDDGQWAAEPVSMQVVLLQAGVHLTHRLDVILHPNLPHNVDLNVTRLELEDPAVRLSWRRDLVTLFRGPRQLFITQSLCHNEYEPGTLFV